MPKADIRRIAKELNLSISTISKALRDSHEISAETKQKVLALAREWQYTPNPYASSLRRKKSNTIAVVIPEVADSFFSLAINGIESIAREKNYHVIVYLTHEDPEREASILQDLSNGRVDGVLMSVSSETDNFEPLRRLHQKNLPLVFFDRICEEIPTATVTTNDFDSAQQATEHLLAQGCRRIAYLSVGNNLSINNRRMEGYQAAMAASPHAPEALVVACPNDADATRQTILELLISANRPDGLVASVEKLAIPVYETCQRLGLQMPVDLKLVCFGNPPVSHILHPPLTTITQPAFDMGKAAAQILFKALTKPGFELKREQVVIGSKLEER